MLDSRADYRALVAAAAQETEARLSCQALLLAITDALIAKGIVTQEQLDESVRSYNELQFKELPNGRKVYENEEGYAQVAAMVDQGNHS